MRAVIQRVNESSVTIGDVRRAAIRRGLLILVAVEEPDGAEDIQWLAGKIARLRVFPDDQGLMNRDVSEIGGELLVVSQFTLYGSTRKGNRPSFVRSARPEQAIPIYEAFVRQLSEVAGRPVATGEFGAMMQVALVNDGPVTLIIDSKNRE
ncbi:MAG: D-tyrosyl-tRNA(Tyr) deacylase [Verrucomicrobiales bacterium]|nr:D-tyrosyl-tRNA(Tyr) deacylase [Verrucomicrobiales bacterium]